MNIKILFTLLTLLMCSVAQAQPSGSINPEVISSQVTTLGAKNFVRKYYGTKEWGAVFFGAASGDENWLQVVKLIMPGTDAGSTSELSDAVAWALPKAPKEVLLLSHEVVQLRFTCSGPPVDEPPGGIEAYFVKSIEAVNSISEEELQNLKSACLKSLISAQERVKQR